MLSRKCRVICLLSLTVAGIFHGATGFECDAGMQQDIDFAIQELRGLSESGVYETLELVEVKGATRTRGMYHDILNFSCVLDSPYMVHRFSQHQMFLMTGFNDGAKAITIDVYPEMQPEAIQTFLDEKIQRLRRQRETALEQLERAALGLQQQDIEGATIDLS